MKAFHAIQRLASPIAWVEEDVGIVPNESLCQTRLGNGRPET
jgi:hypothetical protein